MMIALCYYLAMWQYSLTYTLIPSLSSTDETHWPLIICTYSLLSVVPIMTVVAHLCFGVFLWIVTVDLGASSLFTSIEIFYQLSTTYNMMLCLDC